METAALTPSDRRRLVRDLVFAYLLAWGVGIGYGYAIHSSTTWDTGSAWERSVLVWFHMTLPRWLDAIVMRVKMWEHGVGRAHLPPSIDSTCPVIQPA